MKQHSHQKDWAVKDDCPDHVLPVVDAAAEDAKEDSHQEEHCAHSWCHSPAKALQGSGGLCEASCTGVWHAFPHDAA